MPTANVNGTSLYYEDRGRGPALLLLHGFPLSSQSFRPQLDFLSKKYRVIVPDHRGFGKTPAGEAGKPLEMRQIALDAFALLDHLGVKQAVAGGVSMGGYAAMAMLRENAGRVKALLLVDTQPGPDDEAGKRKREENAQAVTRDGMQFLVQTMLPVLIAPAASSQVKREVEKLILENDKLGAAAALRGMAVRPDSKDVLARFAGPAMVVVGEQDALISPEKAKAMADLIRGAQLVKIPGAGHLSNLEAPEAFHRAVEPFLARVP